MIRILNAESAQYSEAALAILKTFGEVEEGDLNRVDLLKKINGYDVLIVRLRNQIDAQVMDAAPSLKAIVSATTGLDHIDVNLAAKRNIATLSLRGEPDFLRTIPATAEHTWGLLLALMRNIPAAHASVMRGEWQRDRFKGRELAGKRLGILGLGRIGEKVAVYGRAFGMSVLAFDPYRAEFPFGVTRKDSLENLMRDSDILSIHVPLTAETANLIGARELEFLPKDACLINTSRGAILDEKGLLDALQTGRLAGAALDVLAEERNLKLETHSPTMYAKSHSNLLITPHIGGATYESMAATEVFMAKKLQAYLRVQKLIG